MWKARQPLCLLLVFVFTGCTVYQPLHKKEKPSPEEFYRAYYDYPAPDLNGKVVGEKVTRKYTVRTIEFPLTLPKELEVKNLEEFRHKNQELFKTDQKTANDVALRYTIRVDYYVPKNIKSGEKRPAVLISPILGGNMVVNHFAGYYAKHGMVAAIVYRKRLQWEEGNDDIRQFEDYMRASVMRLRQTLDWLEQQPEVDPSRIGSFGVSYGAILHTVLAAVEPRIRYHVLAMPAGPLSEIITYCPDKGITKLVKYAREHYGWSDEKIEKDLEAVIKTDPILLAPYVPRQKVEVYAAAFDRVVGAGRTFHLWKAMGKPKLKVMPFGHYGGVVVFPLLQIQSYLALKSHLKKN